MKEKRKTLEKNFEDLKFKKIGIKQKLQERGITLIALVVTIIILLILAGVTLNIALSDNGLFSKTKKATEDYKEAQSEEEEAIRQISTQMYSEYVGATVEGYEPASEASEVVIKKETSGLDSNKDDDGKDIAGVAEDGSQTFTAEEGMKWRVWDFDGNTLRIIGNPTTKKITLQGAAGYNNGAWVIDHICKELYSNEEKGAIATNLKRTDIQRVSTYDYTQYKYKIESSKEDGNEDVICFGEPKTYENSNTYPKMWNENDKDWSYAYDKQNKTATGADGECKKWEVIGNGDMENTTGKGTSNTEFKQSYYEHKYERDEFINSEYYNLIFKKDDNSNVDSYWLAGRSVLLFNPQCGFGLNHVYFDAEMRSGVNSYLLWYSDRLRRC